MSEPAVLFDVHEGVGTITLNNPDRLNAASTAMTELLAAVLEDARRRDDVRACVLTGAGRAFCGGALLGQERGEPSRDQLKTPIGGYGKVAKAIVGVDKPIIAAVHGVCVGAGFSWALACDRRIADTTQRMAAIWVNRGIMPDSGALHFLPRIVGLARALQIMETGDFVPNDEALRIGLIDELVEEGGDVAAAQAYAARLARGANVVIDLTRRALYDSFNTTLEASITYEAWATEVSFKTADRAEGRVSFFEKRPPNYIGR